MTLKCFARRRVVTCRDFIYLPKELREGWTICRTFQQLHTDYCEKQDSRLSKEVVPVWNVVQNSKDKFGRSVLVLFICIWSCLVLMSNLIENASGRSRKSVRNRRNIGGIVAYHLLFAYVLVKYYLRNVCFHLSALCTEYICYK